jgi:hypothetical protein
MTTKALFSELLYDSHSARWTEFELLKLSLGELRALGKLLGCPSYGTKETLVVRLLVQRALRLKLAPFTDNPAELAASMRRESLRDMCRESRYLAIGKETCSRGRTHQLARSLSRSRESVFDRNAFRF